MKKRLREELLLSFNKEFADSTCCDLTARLLYVMLMGSVSLKHQITTMLTVQMNSNVLSTKN